MSYRGKHVTYREVRIDLAHLTMYRFSMAKTIEQKHDGDTIAKAGELIEIRGTGELTLHDRRVLNLLYERAGDRICDDVEHVIPISALRGSHKGGERVKDSVIRLMRTVVEVPTKGRNGKPATKLLPILSETTISDDDDDPTGEVIYSFSAGMRAIISKSHYWGRVRGQVMFAFTSKYALTLYELIALRVNLSHKWQEEFSLEDFRALLGVPDGKLERAPDIIRYCVQPAEMEVNGLADFGVKVEPIRHGGSKRGTLSGFRVSWWRKEIPELKEAFAELRRSKVGRLARLKGEVERVEVVTALPAKRSAKS